MIRMPVFLVMSLFLLPAFLVNNAGGRHCQPASFDSIAFQTGPCFGFCPQYHLKVYSDTTFKLYAEKVFDTKGKKIQADTAHMGYFTGRVADTLFTRLNTEIQKMHLDSLDYQGNNCCDASLKTFVVYYHHKSKEISVMFPPPNLQGFIKSLYQICNQTPMQRTRDTFAVDFIPGQMLVIPHYNTPVRH